MQKARMKKWIAAILSLAMICCLSACGKSESRATSANEIEAYQNSTDSPTDDLEDDNADDGENPILIAYFTWADNTAVDNPDSIDVDATASASLLPPGNVAQMASWIQKEVGGDLFSIKVTEPYPNDYDECLERAADEKAENTRPARTEQVPNIADYDTVFIGYPNWWYTAPMAVFSFIEENNLSGKKVVLFCSHGTGGFASSVQDITDALPNSSVETNVIGIEREDIPGSQNRIKEWLSEIGY